MSFALSQNVSALSVSGSYEQSLDTIKNGGFLYANAVEYNAFNQVKYVKIEFKNPKKTNFQIDLLYDKLANRVGSNYRSSSTLEVKGKESHVVYFIPKDMSCPDDYTTCVYVSPTPLVGTSTSTRVSDVLNFTGLNIQPKGLFSSIEMQEAKATYYYGPAE